MYSYLKIDNMYLYHLKLKVPELCVGWVHKIGITNNLVLRVDQYKVLPVLFYIVKIREVSEDVAKDIEHRICRTFTPVYGKEYLAVEDYELFNTQFWHGSVEYDEDLDIIIEELNFTNKDYYITRFMIEHGLLPKSYLTPEGILFRGGRISGANKNVIDNKILQQYRSYRSEIERTNSKVVNKIDAIRRNDRALEIIKRVTLGHVYSKAEFEAITNEWVNEVRKDYPELKMNHNSIKVLNEFCSREGLIWESARIKEGGKVIRKYVMRSL